MSLFKRKSRDADPEPEVTDAADVAGTEDDEVGAVGPFDVDDVDGPDGRLDVGALWLPLIEGVELQLQLDEATQQVTGVFIILGDSAVQLQAFAAPRHEGIWREICDEIATGITEQGGTADPRTGPFGHELLARVPGPSADGRVGFQPLRFTGVDGPRWLLRAVFHGSAAVDPEAAALLEELVRHVVVVRGSEPMGPRELLPLHLPQVPADEAGLADPDDDDDEGYDLDHDAEGLPDDLERLDAGAAAPATLDDLNPFQRGPEITERR